MLDKVRILLYSPLLGVWTITSQQELAGFIEEVKTVKLYDQFIVQALVCIMVHID